MEEAELEEQFGHRRHYMISLITQIAKINEQINIGNWKKVPKAPLLKTTEFIEESDDNKFLMSQMYSRLNKSNLIEHFSDIYMLDPEKEDSIKKVR